MCARVYSCAIMIWFDVCLTGIIVCFRYTRMLNRWAKDDTVSRRYKLQIASSLYIGIYLGSVYKIESKYHFSSCTQYKRIY